ncbi:MAG: hypothetical protein WC307_06265 [Candidatus Nanoarchaeia archaeon]|jgi:hypothetical protein
MRGLLCWWGLHKWIKAQLPFIDNEYHKETPLKSTIFCANCGKRREL